MAGSRIIKQSSRIYSPFVKGARGIWNGLGDLFKMQEKTEKSVKYFQDEIIGNRGMGKGA